MEVYMKKVLAFDVDQTLNVAKMPIPDEIAELLVKCLDHYEICPISGQKYEQFLIQIVNRLEDAGVTPEQLSHLHLFVAQGTQYYRYNGQEWEQVYNYPLSDDQVAEITKAIQQAAEELGYWEQDKVAEGDEIIENRLSQVTFSALGQKAGTKPNMLGIQTTKNAKLSLNAAKNSRQNSNTKLVAPLLLMPSLQV